MRILITISRIWRDYQVVRDVLAGLHERHPRAVLVHGAAPQGDKQCADFWESLGGAVDPMPADWSNGRRGGPERNARMVATNPELVLAFIHGQSAGASNCARLADRAGLQVAYWTET